MIALLPLLLSAVPQEPEPPGEYVFTARSVQPEEDGDVIRYHLEDFSLVGPDVEVRAAQGTLTLDAARYALYAEDPDAVPPLPRPERALVSGLWSRKLLLALGLPEDETLLREIHLVGEVMVRGEGLTLRSSVLTDRPAEGTGEATDAILDLPPGRGGPNGWPLRFHAATLTEAADGTVVARDVRITTCLETPPHYALRVERLVGRRNDDGDLVWSPETGWLEIISLPFLPLPTPSFGPGQDFLGLRGVRVDSTRRLGFTIAPRFGSTWSSEDGRWTTDVEVSPAISAKRGFPLEGALEVRGPSSTTTLGLFYLDDESPVDFHGLARYLGRDDDERWRIRFDHRTDFDPEWRLDVSLNGTSDPMVDPEFFHREWIADDDVASEVRLRRQRDDDYFLADLQYRLDDVGFTPIEGLGQPPAPAPPTLDVLPRLSYERFARSLTTLPVGGLGGADGRSPLNVSYGAELARLQLRSREVVTNGNRGPFTELPDRTRDRARLWTEVALPMSALGAFLRPGVRVDGSAWQDDFGAEEDDAQIATEAFLDAGIVLEKHYEHGWRHRVLPQARLRSRTQNEAPDAVPLDFDGLDVLGDGEVLELSLRQFFLAPDQSDPWLDLHLLVPVYPDDNELLRSSVAPFPRLLPADEGVGPAELRVNWTPSAGTDALNGVEWDLRLRHDFDVSTTEEIFTRLTVRPRENVFWGFDYYEAEGTTTDFALGALFGGWRLTEEWAVAFRQSENFAGNAGLRSAWTVQHYGHDYLLEVGYERRQATGDQGVFFTLAPRFLHDRWGGRGIAQVGWN